MKTKLFIVMRMRLQSKFQIKKKWGLRRIWLLFLAVCLLFSMTGIGFCSSFEQIQEAFDKDFNRINPEKIKDRLVSVVEGISEMKITKQVGINYRSRGDVKNELFLRQMKRENLNDERKIQGYEYILRQFHILASDNSYKDVLLSSYYDRMYGYYDPSKHSLILMEGVHKLTAANSLFHELVHAAQDSTVDLIKYQKKYCHSLDSSLAASALLEGQASAVELIVQIERNLEGKTRNEILTDLLDRIQAQMDQNPISKNEGVQNMLDSCVYFPYSYGLTFVLTRIVKENSSFSKMFKVVPVSTEQVLHTQKFNARELPVKTALEKRIDKISSIPGTTLILETSLGEYFIREMFNNVLQDGFDTAKNAASGWGGDKIAVITHANNSFFVWDTLWDSSKDADEFFHCYVDYSKARYHVKNLPPDGKFEASLKTDDNKVLIKKNGNRILIMEGQIVNSTLKNILKVIGL